MTYEIYMTTHHLLPFGVHGINLYVPSPSQLSLCTIRQVTLPCPSNTHMTESQMVPCKHQLTQGSSELPLESGMLCATQRDEIQSCTLGPVQYFIPETLEDRTDGESTMR